MSTDNYNRSTCCQIILLRHNFLTQISGTKPFTLFEIRKNSEALAFDSDVLQNSVDGGSVHRKCLEANLTEAVVFYKIIHSQQAKMFITMYGNRVFITMFTKAHHLFQRNREEHRPYIFMSCAGIE